jgi:hypothetical protein
VDVEPGTWVVDWERLLTTSPNPNAAAAGKSIRAALDDEEQKRDAGRRRRHDDAEDRELRLQQRSPPSGAPRAGGSHPSTS